MGDGIVFENVIKQAVSHKLRVIDCVNTFFFYLKKAVEKHNYNEVRDTEYDDLYKLMEKIEPSNNVNVHHNFIIKIDLIGLLETYFDLATQARGDSGKFKDLLNILKKQTEMSEDLFSILKNSVPLLCSEEVEMIPVKSSNIESVGYDNGLREVYIKFMGGKTYKYFDINIREFEELRDAPSVGWYLSEHIKPFKEYQKVK